MSAALLSTRESLMMNRISVFGALMFAGALFIGASSSERADAGENIELQVALKKLETATSVTIMIIPHAVRFSIRVDETRLPGLACIYEARIEPDSAALKGIFDLFVKSFLEFKEGYQSVSEVRIGIIFRNGKILREFYFEDWGGLHNVHGLTEPYHRILAAANFPDQLRAFVTRQDIDLIRSNNRRCPQHN
jgi:hypothetical protein